ncbi:hypothetical protein AAL_03973 [Moelleriella libera RCEF 2490]|uniref:Uncharacterized protein n=1 Tax=Moelleriella libera RCEF 2490 TaxID=1081109 RepID=A0A168CL93_9HYPO|nr:hypothetical protein AAL_03973 [Moelleriella libera RCEF 2490]
MATQSAPSSLAVETKHASTNEDTNKQANMQPATQTAPAGFASPSNPFTATRHTDYNPEELKAPANRQQQVARRQCLMTTSMSIALRNFR